MCSIHTANLKLSTLSSISHLWPWVGVGQDPRRAAWGPPSCSHCVCTLTLARDPLLSLIQTEVSCGNGSFHSEALGGPSSYPACPPLLPRPFAFLSQLPLPFPFSPESLFPVPEVLSCLSRDFLHSSVCSGSDTFHLCGLEQILNLSLGFIRKMRFFSSEK